MARTKKPNVVELPKAKEPKQFYVRRKKNEEMPKDSAQSEESSGPKTMEYWRNKGVKIRTGPLNISRKESLNSEIKGKGKGKMIEGGEIRKGSEASKKIEIEGAVKTRGRKSKANTSSSNKELEGVVNTRGRKSKGDTSSTNQELEGAVKKRGIKCRGETSATNAQIEDTNMAEVVEVKEYRTIATRMSPRALFGAIYSMNRHQREMVIEMGFGALLNMKTDSIPSRLAHYVVSAFNPDTMQIECGTGNIPVTRDTVHEALGLPMGEHQLQSLPFRGNEDWYDEWSAQFNKSFCNLLPSDILSAIIRRPFADMVFKANFILLLCSTLGSANKMGACTCGVMSFIRESMNFQEVDWCTYILSFVRSYRETWYPDNPKSVFQGPATLLTFRENAEIDAGGFGQGDFIGPDLGDDSDENFENTGSDEDEETDEDEENDEDEDSYEV